LTKEEVTLEELEKQIRNLRENYQDFAVVTIAAIILVLIRFGLGTEMVGLTIDSLIAILMFVAAGKVCYLYRHREDS